jgi:asparagine synthase (glutamine-hydrolysing)
MHGIFHFEVNDLDLCGRTCHESDRYVVKVEGDSLRKNVDTPPVFKRICSGVDILKILNELRGGFVVVILDRTGRRLHLARDHFGLMPLYYTVEKERAIFGTTITSVAESRSESITVNEKVIHEYFIFRYIAGKNTFFKDIYEVKPGAVLSIDDRGEVTYEDYYDFDYSSGRDDGDADAEKRFNDTFLRSLRENLSDAAIRTIGVLSSGGIDSSILVSCSGEFLGPNYHTYYIENEGYRNSRRDDVLHLSELYSTRHTNISIPSTGYAKTLTDTIRINEEPLNHPCSILRHHLFDIIGKEVDAVITGEGADCFFCGYYIFDLIRYFYVKNPVRSLSSFIMRLLPLTCIPAGYRLKAAKIKNAFVLPPDEYAIFHDLLACNTKEEVHALLGREFPRGFAEDYTSLFRNYSKVDILDIILNIYQTYYIIEALNTLHKLSKANQLELRHPFIDVDLVDLFNSFPWHRKIGFFQRKRIMVELGKRYLPEEFFGRGKEGFGVPLKELFYDKNGLQEYMELLSDVRTRARGVFDNARLDLILDRYRRRTLTEDQFECLIWPIINLELWYRIFIDGDIEKGERNVRNVRSPLRSAYGST